MKKITKDCLKKYDLNDFLGMLKSFPRQIIKTIENDDFVNDFAQPKSNISKILICGMGGSAVGGDLLNSLIFLPFERMQILYLLLSLLVQKLMLI